MTADAGWHLVLDYQHADETTAQSLGKAPGKASVAEIRGVAGSVGDLWGVHEIIVHDDDARDHGAL